MIIYVLINDISHLNALIDFILKGSFLMYVYVRIINISINLEIVVAIAAPLAPRVGNGPIPNINK